MTRSANRFPRGYRSPYAPSNETPPQISAHSPSESSSTQIGGQNAEVGSPPDQQGCDRSRRHLPPPHHNAKEPSHGMAVFLPIRSSNDGETAFPP